MILSIIAIVFCVAVVVALLLNLSKPLRKFKIQEMSHGVWVIGEHFLLGPIRIAYFGFEKDLPNGGISEEEKEFQRSEAQELIDQLN